MMDDLFGKLIQIHFEGNKEQKVELRKGLDERHLPLNLIIIFAGILNTQRTDNNIDNESSD